ncbi:MAG: LysR family transcriptional regulator [Archangium sp.]|nr:LysR family transcriptional regulator [Archangium sp.]
MNGTPDWNLLPLFVAVAETQSISGAARALDMPKSTLSRGIAALEASLGVSLLHRTTRNVAMTTAGHAFYEKARPLVAAFRELTASLPEQEAEPSGALKISVPVDIGLTFLSTAFAQFAARYPSITLDVRVSNEVAELVKGGFDVGLRIGALKDSTLVARRLGPIELGLFAAPAYLARRGTLRSLEECTTHDWVLFANLRLARALKVPTTPRILTDDLLFARNMVRSGMGLGVLPLFLARDEVHSGALTRVLPKWSMAAGSLFFVHPPGKQQPRKVLALRDFLIDFIARGPLG